MPWYVVAFVSLAITAGTPPKRQRFTPQALIGQAQGLGVLLTVFIYLLPLTNDSVQ